MLRLVAGGWRGGGALPRPHPRVAVVSRLGAGRAGAFSSNGKEGAGL